MRRLVTLIALFVSGCGSDSSTSAPTLTGAAASTRAAATTVEKMAIFTSATRASSANAALRAANPKWTQTGGTWGHDLSADEGCSGTADPVSYMGNVLYSGCPGSNFWDLMGMFRLSCAVFASVPATAGIPDVASETTLTVNPAIMTLCDLPADISDYEPITATIEATSSTTVYQRKITIGVAGIPSAYVFWYGENGDDTNIQFRDGGLLSPGGNGANSVGFYTYNSSTEVTLFELQSRYDADTVAFFVRLHMDGQTEVATSLGTIGDEGTTPGAFGYVRWSAEGFAGDPADGDPSNPIAVNMAWKIPGQAADSLSTCVTPGTYVSEGTSSSCGTYSTPGSVANIDTFIGGVADSLNAMNNAALLNIADETTTPSFTVGNMASTAPVN